MQAFWSIFTREVRLICSRKSYLFLFLLWPLLDGLMLAGIYAEKVVVDMPIAVADNDGTALSRTVVRFTDASRSLAVRYRVHSVEEIEDLLFRNKITAGIYIPAHFERDVKKGRTAIVTAYIDGANILTANLALSDLNAVVGTVAAGVKITYLRKTGSQRDKALALQAPVQTELSKLYNPGYNYLNYLAPGLWMAVLQQLLLLFGTLMIAQEFEKGTAGELQRLSKGRLLPLITGKIAPYICIGLLLQEIFFRVFFPLFHIEFKGSVSLLSAFSALFVLAAISLGYLLAAVLRSRGDALKGVILLGAPAFLLSGYTWPLQSMPAVLQAAVQMLPLTPYLQGLRKIYQQGAGIEYLYGNAAALIMLSALYLSAANFFLQRRLAQTKARTEEDSHVV
jgi:ABC-2 type transport system permease protein